MRKCDEGLRVYHMLSKTSDVKSHGQGILLQEERTCFQPLYSMLVFILGATGKKGVMAQKS